MIIIISIIGIIMIVIISAVSIIVIISIISIIIVISISLLLCRLPAALSFLRPTFQQFTRLVCFKHVAMLVFKGNNEM